MNSTEPNIMFKIGTTSSPGTLSVTNRVGIQTDTPGYPLDVAGDARVGVIFILILEMITLVLKSNSWFFY